MFSLTFWTKCFWLSGVKNIVYSVVRGSGTFYDLIFAKSPVWCRGKGEMYFGVPQICKKKKNVQSRNLEFVIIVQKALTMLMLVWYVKR